MIKLSASFPLASIFWLSLAFQSANAQVITFNEFARHLYFDAENAVNINEYAHSKPKLIKYDGPLEIQYGEGDWIERNAKITLNPTKPNDNVLQFTINSPNCCNESLGRVQLNAYKLQHLKRVKVSVDVFIPQSQKLISDFPGAMNFLTISEWWNDEGWGDRYPFRVSVNVVKDTEEEGAPLVLDIRAQIKDDSKAKMWQGAVWKEKNSTFHIPFNKWFTLKYEFIEGDETHGKFVLNAEVDGVQHSIFDITNFTHHPEDPSPNGLTAFNPVKLYTNRQLIDHLTAHHEPLTIYWDNLSLD